MKIVLRRSLVGFCLMLCIEALGAQYPVKIGSLNHRILVDQNNIPFLMVGDSPQSLMVNLTPADAAFYLADRATNGFNTVLVDAICNPYVFGPANASLLNGTLPFTNTLSGGYYDLTTPNEAYFAYLDQIINLAATNGIEVMLDPIETGGWLSTMLANGTTNCRAYGQYLGNRYKNFPNVMWSSGNDYQNWATPANDAVVTAVALGIKDEDTNHLQTIELGYDVSSSLDDTNWAPIVGLNGAYTYSPTYAEVLHAYNQSGAIPTFMIEANYEYEKVSSTVDGGLVPHNLRMQEYWTMLSGASGQLYGNHYTVGFMNDWQSYLDSPGVTQLDYMANLFGSRAWYNLVPDQAHVFVTGGYGIFTNGLSGNGSGMGTNVLFTGNNYVTAAVTPDGTLGMAYLPQGGTITVAMSKLQNSITARWFDPSANRYTSIAGSPFTNTGTQNFPSPGNNSAGDPDWVLVLERPPTIHITVPTPGLQVSNANYTVTGTATDNVGVSNVFVQLNNSGWNPATSLIGSNWTAQVTLTTPGPNTIQAYAVDTSGNISTNDTVNFNYVVSAMLTVQLTGKGTISPNYSNAWLAIGTNYTMTASVISGLGFVFTNWTDGNGHVVTNGATVKFVMISNLVLEANFLDVTKPMLTITAPTAGERWSNAVFTVKGTASDNYAVSNVSYLLNNGVWTNASGTTNWSAAVSLVPGTNYLWAYATDLAGNNSATNRVAVDFVVTNQLTVQANGLGTISPNYSNAWLEIGRNYSLTATPAGGFRFTNWTGNTGWVSNTATLNFMMESNLMLKVSFVDTQKPMLTITAPTTGQHLTNALANVKGTASDNWKISNVWYQLNNNAWSSANTTNVWTNWWVMLPLASGTNMIRAYALDLGGNFSTTNSVSFVSSNTFKLQLDLAVQPLGSNGLNYALQISPGINGTVQVSTNLIDWQALTNFVGSNTTINLLDKAATNFNQRFYRAVAP